MKLKLSQRFNLYIGAILLIGMIIVLIYDVRADAAFLRELGLSEARRLCTVAFNQIYTSMSLGGGRAENRDIIERFRQTSDLEEVRLIHAPKTDHQFGAEADEAPVDNLDLEALAGTPAGIVERSPSGHLTARFVMPFFMKEECLRCHTGTLGQVNGAISVRLSLERYEGLFGMHSIRFIFWGGGILAIVSIAVLATVNRRLLRPIGKVEDGAEALAGGDLACRVSVSTGDELENLADSFNRMAESLQSAMKSVEEASKGRSRLVEMAVDPILLIDPLTMRFTDANRAATVLTGYSKEDLLGMTLDEIHPAGVAAAHKEWMDRWLHDGSGYMHDAVVVHKAGYETPVEVAASVIDVGGNKLLQEIWRDLSERRVFEKTLRAYVDGLEAAVKERTESLNRTVMELEEAYIRLKDSEQVLIQSAKMRSLGEMGAGIAHELNSPIAGILSITEALMRRTDPAERSYFLLEKIKDAAVRSKYIILDMLMFSRPDKEGGEKIDVNELVKSTLLLFISEIKTRSIDVIEDLDPVMPAIAGNKGQLMEVILNILKNARDAMPSGGSTGIRTGTSRYTDGLYAIIEITDTGPGIPADVMDRIFDPFFSTKEKGGGMNIGLGLSISQGIVKNHGGRIEAVNRGQGGTSFTVYLPVRDHEGDL